MCKTCGRNIKSADVTELAATHGWIPVPVHPKNYRDGMRSFVRGDQRMNVWITMMTVATAIDHPTKGRTQLYRKHCDLKTLAKIFRNPRQHTGRGYYWK